MLNKDKRRKVIISRQLLTSGHTTFVIGTKFGGIINRDSEEIPLSSILDHVSYSELQRYENQEYLLEDEREEKRPTPKPKGWPKGRPRKKLLANEDTSRESTAAPNVSIYGKRPLARPRKVAVVVPSTSPTAESIVTRTPTVATPQRVTVQVPLTTTPQSVKFGTPVPRILSLEVPLSSGQKPSRRPQYSMVAASGLAPSETSFDDEPSREESVSRAESHNPLSLEGDPLPKRRKLTLNNDMQNRASFLSRQLQQGLDNPPTEQTPLPRRARPTPGAYDGEYQSNSDSEPEDIGLVDALDVRDEEAEREALLRQFQTSNIPQSRPRSPLQRSSKANNVTMKPFTPSPHSTQEATKSAGDIVRAVNGRSKNLQSSPMPSAQFATPPHLPNELNNTSDPSEGTSSDSMEGLIDPELKNGAASNSKISISQLSPTLSSEVATPRKSTQRRASLTPHFPRGKLLTSNALRRSASTTKARPTTSPTKSTALPTTKPTALLLRTKHTSAPSRPIQAKPKPAQPPNTKQDPPRPSTKPSTSQPLKPNPPKPKPNPKLLRQPSVPPRDITAYFRPKAKPAPPLTAAPPSSSSSSSDSEDPLIRSPASSYDSLKGKTIVVQRRSQHTSPILPETQAANDSAGDSSGNDPKSQVPVDRRGGQRDHPVMRKVIEEVRREIPDSEDEMKKSTKWGRGSSGDFNLTRSAIARSRRGRRSGGMDGVEEVDDDDDEDEDEGRSPTDAPSSQILVMRKR